VDVSKHAYDRKGYLYKSERTNYVGSKKLPTSIEEKGPPSSISLVEQQTSSTT